MEVEVMGEQTSLLGDAAGLPPTLQATFDRLVARGVRYWVAWHPDFPNDAVLRPRSRARMEEVWGARQWTRFGGAPRIVDVTDAIPSLWASAHAECPGTPGRYWWPWRVLFVPPASLACAGAAPPGAFDLTLSDMCWLPVAGYVVLGGCNPDELEVGAWCYPCGAPAATAEEETAHAAATGHDDWLDVTDVEGVRRSRRIGTRSAARIA